MIDHDLLVVLEGGSMRFQPKYERVSEIIRLYQENNKYLLVCSNRSAKNEILDYLTANGVKREDLVISEYVYDKSGGKYNNIKELISVIKINKDFESITIGTSPYHELRVDMMFSELLIHSGIERKIHLSFAHIENSEVQKTDVRRFMRIIVHELIGIMAFKFKLIVEKLTL